MFEEPCVACSLLHEHYAIAAWRVGFTRGQGSGRRQLVVVTSQLLMAYHPSIGSKECAAPCTHAQV